MPLSTKLLQRHRRLLAKWLDLVLPPGAIDPRYGYDAFEPRYGLKYARPHYLLRVLDPALHEELGLPFEELSLPAEPLARLPVHDVQVLIVENKVSLLAIPARRRAIALGGIGSAVTQLADIGWLHTNDVVYWGDLDAEGFAILESLRSLVPDVRSLLMDETTLGRFRSLATPGTGAPLKSLPHLTNQERQCYQIVCGENLRIEQEHLPMQAFTRALDESSMAIPR